MMGDSESNLRLWRVAGRKKKQQWVELGLSGHTRGVHAVAAKDGLACSASSAARHPNLHFKAASL